MPFYKFKVTVSTLIENDSLNDWSFTSNQDWCGFWARKFYAEQKNPYFQLKVLEEGPLAILFELQTALTAEELRSRIISQYPNLIVETH